MDSVAAFAVKARAFEQWLLSEDDQGVDAARAALIHLLTLYTAALALPTEWSDELEGASEVERVSDAHMRKASEASRRLPLDLYSEVFNPLVVPAEETVAGSLADDIGDVYGDVVSGLRAYERGDRAGAVWEWSFGLHAHWGAHATGAIRALHWWLVENAFDRLSVPRSAG